MNQRRTIGDIGTSASTAPSRPGIEGVGRNTRSAPTLDTIDSDFIDIHTRLGDETPAHTRTPASLRPKTTPLQSVQRAARLALFAAVFLELSIVAAFVLVGTHTLGTHGMALLLGLHGLAAALAATSWRALTRQDRLAPHHDVPVNTAMRLVALGIFTLGPLGLLGSLVAWLLKRRHDRRGVAQDARWLSMMSPSPTEGWKKHGREHLLPQEDPAIRAALEDQPSVGSFSDILSHGSVTQRQAVVSAIAARYQPSFAPSLQRALRDPDTTVRMMAAAAIERLETRHLEASMAFESAWAQAPEDPMAALRLAQHYDAYANSGLIDAVRTRRALERALEMYQLAGERRPDDPLIAQSVLRVLTRLHREEDALQSFGPILEAGAAPATMSSWLLECLFRRRRYTELRQHARALMGRERDFDTLTTQAQQAVGLWSSDTTSTRELAEVDADVDPRARNRRAGPRGRFGDPPVIDMPYFAPRWSR